MTIVEKQGRARFNPGDGNCAVVAWNPRADLSAPTRTITLTLGELGTNWSFKNVRAYQGQDHSLRVWGELVNHSGRSRRINFLLPLFIQNGDGDTISFDVSFFLQPLYQDMFNSVSLNDGQSLPFDFDLYLPQDARLVGEAQVVMQLDLDPNRQIPNRENLNISSENLELSGELDVLRVSGFWENPGPSLNEYAIVVVTAYGQDDQVLGWGWQSGTDSDHLATGRHDFVVDVALADFVTDWEQFYYYQVQLLAR